MYDTVKRGYNFKKYWVSILFATPFLLIFLFFTVIPVISAMVLSLTNFNALQPPSFVWLQNYLILFLEDDVFPIAFQNTIMFALVLGPTSFFCSLLVAWVLNEYSRGMRTVLTVMFYSPAICGSVQLVWKIIFSGDTYGMVNNLLIRLGFIEDPIQWLADPKYIFGVIAIATIWSSFSTGFLAFIAAFKGVDKTLYEAGAIDGVKNRLQELWYITIPSIKNLMMFSALISITNSFAIGALCTALVGFPSPNYAAHTLVLHMEDYGSTRFELGIACAIATILFVMMVGTNKLVNIFIRNAGK